MLHQKRFTAAFLLFLISSFIHGCAGKPTIEELTVVQPMEFQHENTKWVKGEWIEEYDKRLSAYFAKNPSLAANPLFGGEKVAYSDSKGLDRFYWVLPAPGSAAWICFEFKGKSFSKMLEGSGEPFHSTSES